jgi:hypothetical protein
MRCSILRLIFERSSEVRQDRQRDEIDADQRLYARYHPDPSCSSQGIFARLNPRDPGADVKLVPADASRGERAG